MYNNNFVEFKRERDLGAIISDTFKFLRLEWKLLFSITFSIVIIPFVILFTLSVYDGVNSMNNLNGVNFSLITFIVGIISVLVFYLLSLIVNSYIKEYIENSNGVNRLNVVNYVKNHFLSFSGLGVISTIIILAGTIFCFFPGIYFMVTLSMVGSIYVFQAEEALQSISNTFKVIKGYWWETFGVLIIVFIILVITSFIFSIPAMMYLMIKTSIAISSDNIGEIASIMTDPIYIFLALISSMGQYLLYVVYLISTVFIYFDINERKNASGAMDKINSLGN